MKRRTVQFQKTLPPSLDRSKERRTALLRDDWDGAYELACRETRIGYLVEPKGEDDLSPEETRFYNRDQD